MIITYKIDEIHYLKNIMIIRWNIDEIMYLKNFMIIISLKATTTKNSM